MFCPLFLKITLASTNTYMLTNLKYVTFRSFSHWESGHHLHNWPQCHQNILNRFKIRAIFIPTAYYPKCIFLFSWLIMSSSNCSKLENLESSKCLPFCLVCCVSPSQSQLVTISFPYPVFCPHCYWLRPCLLHLLSELWHFVIKK